MAEGNTEIPPWIAASIGASFTFSTGMLSMAIYSKTLATGGDGSWMIVLNPGELHLYVGFAQTHSVPDPGTGKTIEDFIAAIPTSTFHREAQDELMFLLRTLLA